ncbi:MAG: HD domain-containing protein [Oscillospiraceae bacterium]|nr:HD domain-containing protein [Oscillospiraceae bacterium]
MSFEKQFIEIYQKNILRPGSEKLLNYLLSDSSDFFTAPCSSRFHGAYEGGLAEHSVNVYNCLRDYLDRSRVTDVYNMTYSEETVAIAALLHDLCKINFYTVDFRNAKNARGEWEKVPYYTIDDDLPYGHGEKSVYIISGFMRLSREEAFAIRYHMGFSDTQDKNNVSKAFEKFPLSLALSIADMEATFYLESNTNK